MSDGEIPGADGPDEQFEALLREHLASRLDGQLGRAAAHFQRYLSGTGGGFGAGPRTGSLRRSWGGWVVGIVGGGMAAASRPCGRGRRRGRRRTGPTCRACRHT